MSLVPVPTRKLLLHLALCLASGAAAANLVDKLQRGDELACVPAWPFFCANIHVSCAGQTTVRAFAFTLRTTGAHAALAAVDDGTDIADTFARMRVVHDAQNQAVLLLPASTSGYLKLQADGRYSFRHYVARGGIMSAGRCE